MSHSYSTDAPRKPKPDTQTDVEKFLASGNKITKVKPGETNITPKVLLSTGLGVKK